MPTTWARITIVFALLLAMAGCYSTDRQKIKPPKREELYNLPPQGDNRWDKPIEYPKGTLNQDSIKQDKDSKDGPNSMRGPGAPKFGASAGGGGGGY